MSLKRFSQPFRRKPRSLVPEDEFSYSLNPFVYPNYADDDVLDNLPDIALDDTLTEDVELTPGGWICRVERFEKIVDSSGRIRYNHQRKESPSPVMDQDLAEAKKPEKSKKDKPKKIVEQSIISYFHQTTKTNSNDLIDPDVYIQVKSPLILEVLRKNTSYGHQV